MVHTRSTDFAVTGEDPFYPIQPCHINTKDCPLGTLGSREAEGIAPAIINFFQDRGRWGSITYQELVNGISTKQGVIIKLHSLSPGFEFFCELSDGRLALRHSFISNMFMVSPAKELVPERFVPLT